MNNINKWFNINNSDESFSDNSDSGNSVNNSQKNKTKGLKKKKKLIVQDSKMIGPKSGLLLNQYKAIKTSLDAMYAKKI